MAKFTRMEKQYYLSQDRIWYLVDGKLSEQDVRKINSLNTRVVLVLKNTKGQNSDIIKKFSSNVLFSVVGGLDYLHKQKFKDMDYVDRTIITPVGLAKIIEYFEKIEKNLRYTWTDTQKCMYIYKTLVENLHYKYKNEKDRENGCDVVRSLYGLLYGKLVCSGFALVFKEAMDRIGIPCLYQNRKGHHSWNIVKLDGKLRSMELTWDCDGKGKDNKCYFKCFGRTFDNKSFYQNDHHDISKETEEKEYPVEEFTEKEIIENLRIIQNQGNVKTAKMNALIDPQGNRIYYFKINVLDDVSEYMVLIDKELYTVYTKEKESVALTKQNILNACKDSLGYIGKDKPPHNIRVMKKYRRRDSSTFKILKSLRRKDNVEEFYYYDTITKPDGIYFRRLIILSEMNLTLDRNESIEEVIANNLLSQDRIERKIAHYHGYVGYVGVDSHTYYNQEFEENSLNIHKRH